MFLLFSLLSHCAGHQIYNKSHYPNSAYDINSHSLVSTNLKKFSSAPLQVVEIAEINVPQNEAFILTLSKIHKWFPGVEEFKWDHSKSEKANQMGAGSVRNGKYKGKKMVEVIRAIQEPNYYIYQINLNKTKAFLPIKNHLGVFTVEKINPVKSLIIWRQYFDGQIPLTEGIISRIMGFIAHKAFKNLVKIYGGKLHKKEELN